MSNLRYLCLFVYSDVDLMSNTADVVQDAGSDCISRVPAVTPVLLGSVVLFVLALCVVFLFCLSSSRILCTVCCKFLWIVYSWLPLRYSFTFIIYSKINQHKHVGCYNFFLVDFRLVECQFLWYHLYSRQDLGAYTK